MRTLYILAALPCLVGSVAFAQQTQTAAPKGGAGKVCLSSPWGRYGRTTRFVIDPNGTVHLFENATGQSWGTYPGALAASGHLLIRGAGTAGTYDLTSSGDGFQGTIVVTNYGVNDRITLHCTAQ
jgi:hypothetical protein